MSKAVFNPHWAIGFLGTKTSLNIWWLLFNAIISDFNNRIALFMCTIWCLHSARCASLTYILFAACRKHLMSCYSVCFIGFVTAFDRFVWWVTSEHHVPAAQITQDSVTEERRRGASKISLLQHGGNWSVLFRSVAKDERMLLKMETRIEAGCVFPLFIFVSFSHSLSATTLPIFSH